MSAQLTATHCVVSNILAGFGAFFFVSRCSSFEQENVRLVERDEGLFLETSLRDALLLLGYCSADPHNHDKHRGTLQSHLPSRAS
jgi:hypothetical protein